METPTKKNQLIRIVPFKAPRKKTKVVTTRFTEEEKEKIDNIVKDYGTTLTDFVRNAVFYYIKNLEYNHEEIIIDNKISKIDLFQLNRKKLNYLKEAIKNIENQLERVENRSDLLEISKEL